MSATPYLSVVATARNDDHGGNLLRRMQTFVNALVGQAKRHGVNLELILVEWNPPADRPKLMDALQWPDDLGPCEVRIIEVPGEIHRRFRHADALPLYQMIAKNVGIRRARGEFILATNIDIVFADEFFQLLSERRLERGKMYRVDRYDTASEVPVDAPVEEQLAYCRSHLLRLNTREGSFPVTPEGLFKLAENDIAEQHAGLYLGVGWYPVERCEEGIFRWVSNDARVIVDAYEQDRGMLSLEIEPGPGVRRSAFLLQVVDEAGLLLIEEHVEKRRVIQLPLRSPLSGRKEFVLRIIGGGKRVAHDPRVLNVRVHRCFWEKPPAGASSEHTDKRLVEAPAAASSPAGTTRQSVTPWSRGRLSLPVPRSLLDTLQPSVQEGRLSLNFGLGSLRDSLPRWRASRMPQPRDGFSDDETLVLWGRGWYPVEIFRGLAFRWCGWEAEAVVYMPEGPAATLALLVEPGPGVGFEPCHLQIKDSRGKTISTAVVDRLRWIYLSLPWSAGRSEVFTVRVQSNGSSKVVPRESRTDLCFRVLQCGWLGGAPEHVSGRYPPPWRESLLDRGAVVPANQGIALGAGWGPLEEESGFFLRTAHEDAELIVLPPESGEARLHLDIEPLVPDLDVCVCDSDARCSTSFALGRRDIRTIELPRGSRATTILRFSRLPGGACAAAADEPLFRLFHCSWSAIPPVVRAVTAQKGPSGGASLPSSVGGVAAVARPVTAQPGTLSAPASIAGSVSGMGPLTPEWSQSDGDDGPAHLHTNACGDFTLLAREHWLDLRAYPEFDLFSMNIDSVFCYSAHYGGAPEEVLPDPIRIYHIEHAVGSGWTPEGQTALFERVKSKGLSWIDYHELLGWARQMSRLRLPMIFNREDWGLANDDLCEKVISPSRAQGARTS